MFFNTRNAEKEQAATLAKQLEAAYHKAKTEEAELRTTIEARRKRSDVIHAEGGIDYEWKKYGKYYQMTIPEAQQKCQEAAVAYYQATGLLITPPKPTGF